MDTINVPLIILGEIIEDYKKEFGGRADNVRFKTPDVVKYLDRLMNDDPLSLENLYPVSLDDIIEFLSELGRRLDLDNKPALARSLRGQLRARYAAHNARSARRTVSIPRRALRMEAGDQGRRRDAEDAEVASITI
jgi:hypothetical protein